MGIIGDLIVGIFNLLTPVFIIIFVFVGIINLIKMYFEYKKIKLTLLSMNGNTKQKQYRSSSDTNDSMNYIDSAMFLSMNNE